MKIFKLFAVSYINNGDKVYSTSTNITKTDEITKASFFSRKSSAGSRVSRIKKQASKVLERTDIDNGEFRKYYQIIFDSVKIVEINCNIEGE